MAGWQIIPGGDAGDEATPVLVPPAPVQNILGARSPEEQAAIGTPVYRSVVDFWKSKGVPDHVAEGIADRVGVESSFRPDAMGDSGTSGGLYQEHSDRLARLKAFAQAQDKPWTDPAVQNEFAYSETQGGDPTTAKHWDQILKSPNRKTAYYLWTKYFERPASIGSAPAPGGWQVFSGGDKARIADTAVQEAEKHGKTVFYADPNDMLALLPETSDGEGGRKKRSSLTQALARGEDIQDLPEVTGEMQGGALHLTSYDGRHRLEELAKAGVTRIPVVVQGMKGTPTSVVGMSGVTLPFSDSFMPTNQQQAAASQEHNGGALARILAATVRGAEEGFGPGEFGPFEQTARELRQAGIFNRAGGPQYPLGRLYEGVAAAAGVVPRSINALLYGVARGGGQAAGEMTGEAREPGFDPGIGVIRNIYGPASGVATAVPAISPRIPVNMLRERVPQLPTPMSAPVANFLNEVRRVNTVENMARGEINKTLAQDEAAGGLSAAELNRRLEEGRGEGIALADVAGENPRALLGHVARQPGPGRNIVKQWAIGRLGDVDRDSPIATNIEHGIEQNLATGSARTEARNLAEKRAAGAPLWERAMRGGSVAPLERQFTLAFNEADRAASDAAKAVRDAENEATQAAARQSQAGNVYSASVANKLRRHTEAKATRARADLHAAERAKEAARQKLRQAQEDGTANAPGAVWSPYLGRLLENPIIKDGIRRGYRIERNIADGENRPFNPREYAVVGQEPNGDPIVGAVPNMRLLAVAKEGLDSMLDSDAYKDPLTGRLNKAGRAVKILRDGMLNELDRLNPDYKPARDQWAGDSALISAIREGKNFHKQTPEEIREWFASASDSEKQFYRIGAADTLRDDVQRRVFNGDPSKAIINNPRTRNQLMPMFRSPADAQTFLGTVRRARDMFNTPAEVLRGSPTAAREAEDLARRQGLETAADLFHGFVGATAGHPHSALYRFGRAAVREFNPLRRDPATETLVNSAIARLLTSPDTRLSTGRNFLISIPLPKTQNALTRGALGIAARLSGRAP